MSHDTKSTRRGFLRKVLLGTAALPILSNLDLKGAPAFADVPNKPLNENDSLAVTLGYYHDTTKVDKAKFPKKAGANGDKQMCKNCIFYTEGGIQIDKAPGEWGRCSLFSTGLVNAHGWCNSYAQKVEFPQT